MKKTVISIFSLGIVMLFGYFLIVYKELYDSENEKRGNYYFVKPAKYAYLYLEYDDNKNRVKLTIGSNK